MKQIYYCDRISCRGPDCWQRESVDGWMSKFWVAIDIAARRYARTGRRQQVRRADIGHGPGWIVQEIR